MALMGFGEIDDMFSRVDRMMNSMMNSMMGGIGFMDPYEMMNPMNAMNRLALRSAMGNSSSSHHHHHHQHRPAVHHHPAAASALQSYSPYSNPYGHVFPGISSYSSSVVTMTSDGMGRPQVYEASSSTRLAPGGVRETKSTVRDSRTGRHEMSIGHHIQDKSHVVKKSKNVFTGQEDHEEDFVNVEEDEEATFENEWRRRASVGYRGSDRDRYQRSSGLTITELPADEPRLALPAPPVPTSSLYVSDHLHDRENRRVRECVAAAGAAAPSDRRPMSQRDQDHFTPSSSSRSNGRHLVPSADALSHNRACHVDVTPANAASTSAGRTYEQVSPSGPTGQLRRDRREKSKHRREKPYTK